MKSEKVTSGHTNPDAITGAPGSHPGATAIGTASGTAAGAAIGMVGGPVGIAIGAVAGGIVGAVIGHDAGEWNDPSDFTYWKGEYRNRSYFDKTNDFDQDVAPAYRYGSNLGVQNASSTGGRATFESLENTARTQWENARAKSRLTYEQARDAMRDAYNRRTTPRVKISDNDNVAV